MSNYASEKVNSGSANSVETNIESPFGARGRSPGAELL